MQPSTTLPPLNNINAVSSVSFEDMKSARVPRNKLALVSPSDIRRDLISHAKSPSVNIRGDDYM